MISEGVNIIEIYLDPNYSIMKHKGLNNWWLHYYRFGRNYMYDEIYADHSLIKVYNYYKKVR